MRALVSRLFQLVVVLVLTSLLTFLLLYAVPGDAADTRIGRLPNFTPEQRREIAAELRQQLGLDKPLPVQFAIWLKDAAMGNFGLTNQGSPVRDQITARLWPTVELGLTSVVFGVLLAVIASIFVFRTRIRPLRAIVQSVGTVLLVIPDFWLGLLLVLGLAASARALPASGYDSLGESVSGNLVHLVLPALTLGLPQAALYFRYLSTGLRDAAAQPFVVAARARGVGERAIVYRHVLPNAALPTITVIGLVVGSLMSGLVIVESVFSWPGLGSLLVQSVNGKDFNTLAAIVLVTAASYVVVAFVVDAAYRMLDPRTRRSAR